MKKILTLVIAMFTCFGASAQFEKGKKFIGASVSGFDLSYPKAKDFTADLDFNAGYFVSNDLLLKGGIGYGYEDERHQIKLGLTARYYFENNGIFVGTGTEGSWRNKVGWRHHGQFLLKVPVEVGYAYFINRHVTLEPSVYYNVCLNGFRDYSGGGIKIGFGVYF